MKTYYSNGKLLLTAEYLVLDGAKALAVPTKRGQSLKIQPIEEPKILWKSFDHQNKLWFQHEFETEHFLKKQNSVQDPLSRRLFEILQVAHHSNPSVLSNSGYKVETNLYFPLNWGLGSSSTLINNISQWFQIDAFLVLEKTFGGSGYDVACAQNDMPITYQLPKRIIEQVDFNPDFREEIYFIHLKKKKDSRDAISEYQKAAPKQKEAYITEVNAITQQVIASKNISEFEKCINKHEQILSKLLQKKTIKNEFFPDYPRSIKSLGGWGGDFIMVTGTFEEMDFFRSRKYSDIIPFSEMIL